MRNATGSLIRRYNLYNALEITVFVTFWQECQSLLPIWSKFDINS